MQGYVLRVPIVSVVIMAMCTVDMGAVSPGAEPHRFGADCATSKASTRKAMMKAFARKLLGRQVTDDELVSVVVSCTVGLASTPLDVSLNDLWEIIVEEVKSDSPGAVTILELVAGHRSTSPSAPLDKPAPPQSRGSKDAKRSRCQTWQYIQGYGVVLVDVFQANVKLLAAAPPDTVLALAEMLQSDLVCNGKNIHA
jgi:hypothetical protein